MRNPDLANSYHWDISKYGFCLNAEVVTEQLYLQRQMPRGEERIGIIVFKYSDHGE